MKVNYKPLFLAMLAGTCLFASCTSDNNDDPTTPNGPVDPADADALSAVLIMPAGTEVERGTPPAPSSASTAPEVINNFDEITSSNGSAAPLTFNFSNVNGNLGGCYVQVAGADTYFQVPYTSNSSSSGSLTVPIGIPTNVEEGEFCVNFCVYDEDGQVSNIVTSCVNVLRLGTGAVQISLSWDTPTDQDLHVTDPAGNIIYYSDPTSATGGQLDRDDTDGYGPENIFWAEEAPDGSYVVQVHDYDETSTPNNFYITVSGPNGSRSFSGRTQDGAKVNVVTFTKSGDNLNF